MWRVAVSLRLLDNFDFDAHGNLCAREVRNLHVFLPLASKVTYVTRNLFEKKDVVAVLSRLIVRSALSSASNQHRI